ncbi:MULTISPECIES: hypothetical protein [Rhodococcus]|uniref:DUF4386 domain-containing protein n=1 Tax=Rhodococcus opacus TaxID=37919 RepID=A0AAX3YRU9_RHOOP|nr:MULTISPECIES: hypothetical protein [Rhodococcus]NHU46603.1 hypothetical protein [Rhodococcus sp. A14]MBA8963304.1 hypothetical protein [Rhodococcus opacus]MBP2206794.1 hypothetical protein [Rhodococcus opacus]MCZ4584267.1 hypothetical protein [Rhodococcus opacus]MDI9938211.1 hypothetical protein [Rhodococcus sp. IEGM 1351]
MAETQREKEFHRLRTPRSAAVAGIVFAVLFATSLVLLRTALPADPFDETPWVGSGETRIKAALLLAPFAGIAFLWFIGVIRDRLGDLEDRFFATVFLGSGLLFLAMGFVSMGVAGGVLAIARHSGSSANEIVYFGREIMLQINHVYALRMAAVFMISLGTIWLRTGLVPRWLVVTTYLLALALLVIVDFSLWTTLAFPAWVLLVSVYILVTGRRASAVADRSLRSAPASWRRSRR